MSHTRVKTEYQIEGPYGSVEKKTLYAHHHHTCDVITFYDENGKFILSVEDTMENNLIDAINRLYRPNKTLSDLQDDVFYMDQDDRLKCEP